MRTLVTFVLCWSLVISGQSWADAKGGSHSNAAAQLNDANADAAETSTEFMLRDELSGVGRGSEYVSGYYKGAVLMEVNLWGAVMKPGVHHVPIKMNLVNFLSLAGGPAKEAIIEEVLITRKGRLNSKVLKVNLQELIENPAADRPMLEPNDTIIIKQKKPWIDPDVVGLISVAATIVGLVLTGVLVARELGRPR